MSLVNDLLKFQMAILQIHFKISNGNSTNTVIFFLKKCENPLQCKGFFTFFSTKNNHVHVFACVVSNN